MSNEAAISRSLRHANWLNRLARELVREAARADDLVQEVWMAALRNPPEAGREKPWLARVLRNRIGQEARDRRPTLPLEEDLLPAKTRQADHAVEVMEGHERLLAQLRALDENSRALLVARYFEGESPREIAKRLDIPASTVRSQLSRALAELRREFERGSGGDRRAWAIALIPLALRGQEVAGAGLAGLAQTIGVLMTQKTMAAAVVVVALLVLGYGVHRATEEEGALERATNAATTTAEESLVRRAARSGEAPIPATEEAGTTVTDPEPAGRLRIELVDDQGRRLPRARLLAHRGEEILFDALTDDQGILDRDGARGDAELVVLARGHAWYQARIALTGESRLELPEGARLAGRVVVHNPFPSRPVELEVEQHDDRAARLPARVREHLWPVAHQARRMRASIDADGRFAVAGLAPEASLSLRFSGGFRIVADNGRLLPQTNLDRPREGLLLEIRAVPRVVGRILEAGSGAPIAHHPIRLYGETGETGYSVGGHTDAEGRFVLAVGVDRIDRARLRLDRAGQLSEWSIEEPIEDTHDLGDLLVTAAPSWSAIVVDRAGRPIAGALVATDERLLGGPSTAEGRLEIPALSRAIDELLVDAAGHAGRRIIVEREPGASQRIELGATNRIDVRCVDLPEGLVARSVVLIGPLDLLPDAFSFDFASELGRAHSFGRSEARGETEVWLAPDSEGRFSFEDLRANRPFRIVAFDAERQPIAELSGISLSAEERRSVELRFDPALKRLVRIRCLDPDGGPIARARLVLDGEDRELESDAQGLILLVLDRAAPPPSGRIEAEGRVTRTLESSQLAAASLDLRLEPEAR